MRRSSDILNGAEWANVRALYKSSGFTGAELENPIIAVVTAFNALAGGISVGHVNDSGFWVVSNMSGFNVKGGLKTYTLAQIIMSVSIMFLTVIFALILPGAIG